MWLLLYWDFFFRRFFYTSPRALYQVLSSNANKNTKDKKNLKAYFQSWILGETKTSVYTRAECKEATEILVRVASTSNNKSNNIQPMKSETIAT